MEPWVSKIRSENTEVMFVNLSSYIKQRGTDHSEDEEAGHEELEENIDHHYWLDLGNALIMTDQIAKAFISADPKNSDYFKGNAELLKSNLKKNR